jgi:transcriptional regulator with XRE-family HTH domain
MGNFGLKLKELRIKNSLTQGELSQQLKDLGCKISSKCVISQYESNKRVPDIKTIKIIAELFGVSVDYILGRKCEEDDELSILTLYRQLNEKEKIMLTTYANILCHAKKI